MHQEVMSQEICAVDGVNEVFSRVTSDSHLWFQTF